ncbi:MAG: hypothetical protein ABI707_13555 [Ferruginibacter sp.]
MKVLTAGTHATFDHVHFHQHQNILIGIKKWVEAQEPMWDYYRFGIAATGIFIQVTVAAFMIGILGMAGASFWIYGIGIFLAFISNSIAFASSPMRLVLGLFVVSIVVNFSLILCYGIPLLLN